MSIIHFHLDINKVYIKDKHVDVCVCVFIQQHVFINILHTKDDEENVYIGNE